MCGEGKGVSVWGSRVCGEGEGMCGEQGVWWGSRGKGCVVRDMWGSRERDVCGEGEGCVSEVKLNTDIVMTRMCPTIN